MTATPLDASRAWAEFTDPADPGQRLRIDLTWLTSGWHCIFGNGCPGIEADQPDAGCCTLGAHFTDAEDLSRVAAVVSGLGPDEWERHDLGVDEGWHVEVDEATATRVVDGACIFLNRQGFPAGPGCALHQHAVAEGVAPHTTKPDVCWQLPIRRSYRDVERPDGTSYLEITIGEYDRRSWGPGGHDLDWYCTNEPLAHAPSHPAARPQPVYASMRAELVELVGPQAYAVLAQLCADHQEGQDLLRQHRTGAAAGPGPLADGRQLLPLLVHPATAAARSDRPVGGDA